VISESSVQVNGVTLNVAQAGSGPAVLLLHGFPDSWELWRHQIGALADAGYRVIAPDLRGFGKSTRPSEVSAYAMPELVGDVIGLLDALGVDRASVVGHDWGAVLAWSVAFRAPERVTRLVAVSVGHPVANASAGVAQKIKSWYMAFFLIPGAAERVLPLREWEAFRRWAWHGARPGQDPDADRQVAALSRPGALTAGLNWYRANLTPAAMRSMGPAGGGGPRVACPTMGVWSSRDMALTEGQMTGSGRYVDGPWRYERIDDVDHWVPVHAPERLNVLLLDFLAS
jgi:pimeloyl-ACP methyl ester carboxylesterase